MTKKEKLANEYLELRKEFDGDEFKPGLTDNQVWYLVREFKICQLESKIDSVKRAIEEKNLRLKREAFFATPEGAAYKENLINKKKENRKEYLNIRSNFVNWITEEVNRMVPGNWGATVNFGYKSGNVSIGLINRDPERNFNFQFGHDFTIYFDSYNYGKMSPKFELNYGTLGSFDLFNDETRLVYLNGLATISNNKEWLQLLMAKFIENCKLIDDLNEKYNKLDKELNDPEM